MSNIEDQGLPTWNDQIENGLFNALATAMVVITLLFAVFISFVELPELTREEKEKLPPQLVKIMKHKVEVPPEPKPEPKKEEPKPEEKPEPKPESKPKPKPEPKPQVAKKELKKKAKEKAQQSGLLALSEQLNAMRDTAQAASSVTPGANDSLAKGAGSSAKTERVMLGQKAKGTSGGVTGKSFSDVGEGSKLAANQSGRVAQVATVVDTIAEQVEETQAYEKVSGQRSSESIRQMFDKNKSSIFQSIAGRYATIRAWKVM